MLRLIGLGLMLLAAAGFAIAGSVSTPEIDANAAAGAFTLLSGSLLVLRARRRAR